MKLHPLFLLLLVPVIFFFGILSLPRNILEKSSFYPKPLTVDTIWLAKEIKEISTDKLGNKVYELILKDKEVIIQEREKDEGLFSFATMESEDEEFFVKTNRYAADGEVRKIMDAINKLTLTSSYNEEMKAKLHSVQGYTQDIGVKYDNYNYFLYVFLGILCLSMYFPIIKVIIKFLRES